jgi:hypothetical protein
MEGMAKQSEALEQNKNGVKITSLNKKITI